MNTPDERRLAEERFAQAAGGLLRQGANELDAATVSRLNRARQAALAAHDRVRLRPAWRGGGWQAAAAVAAVAVVAVGLWTGRFAPPTTPGATGGSPVPDAVPHPEQAADSEAVLADENLQLIEDLEFYDWMDAGAGPGEGADPDLTG